MHHTQPRLLAAALCLIALIDESHAADAPRIEWAAPADTASALIVVHGEWQTRCPPQLADLQVEGATISVIARPDSQRCEEAPGPYTLLAEAPATLKQAGHETLRVRYLLQDDPVAPPRLMAFALLPGKSSEQREIAPEAGFWWGEAGGEFDHAGPGLGAYLERQGATLALAFNGYADDGRPEWVFGATPQTDAISSIDLSRLSGGRGPFSGYVGPSEAVTAGRLQIEWITSARAVFWFDRPSADGRGIELRPISMVRFDYAQSPGNGWQGQWLLDGSNGETSEAEEFRRVRLGAFVRTEGGFSLLGPGGIALLCESAATRPQSPPIGCELQLEDGRVWRFDDVGLTRMRGRDENGALVSAELLSR